jgi:hypothetical protein
MEEAADGRLAEESERQSWEAGPETEKRDQAKVVGTFVTHNCMFTTHAGYPVNAQAQYEVTWRRYPQFGDVSLAWHCHWENDSSTPVNCAEIKRVSAFFS